jgi:glycosyltransferase involved in cell wall biosynthesis
VDNVAKSPGVHHFRGIDNPGLIRKIEMYRPDFLLIVGWSFRSHLSCMRYFKGKIPVLFRGDSTLLGEKPGIKKILRRIFLKWVYRKVDYALYVGKNNHDYFHKHGIRKEQLFWIPQAIDNDRFYGEYEWYEREAKKWRDELGISVSDLVVLFAGKLQEQKDPEFMLRLAENIPDPRLKIIIVGNGQLEGRLKARASQDKRIIFLDFQNQQKMPVVYRLGDIFVLPSVSETWGLAVNEAMACKRPVIVSAKCGCAIDLIEEEATGWVFEVGNGGELKVVYILQKILNDRTVLDKMGNQAWQKIQSFSYVIAVEKIKQLLLNLQKEMKDVFKSS